MEGIPFLQDALSVIRYHHERWDGSGYPIGLKGDEIPIQARIFAVADVFDALTSKRSYRSKSSAEEAIQYIKEQSGILFDPLIVEALTKLPYKEFIQGESLSHESKETDRIVCTSRSSTIYPSHQFFFQRHRASSGSE